MLHILEKEDVKRLSFFIFISIAIHVFFFSLLYSKPSGVMVSSKLQGRQHLFVQLANLPPPLLALNQVKSSNATSDYSAVSNRDRVSIEPNPDDHKFTRIPDETEGRPTYYYPASALSHSPSFRTLSSEDLSDMPDGGDAGKIIVTLFIDETGYITSIELGENKLADAQTKWLEGRLRATNIEPGRIGKIAVPSKWTLEFSIEASSSSMASSVINETPR